MSRFTLSTLVHVAACLALVCVVGCPPPGGINGAGDQHVAQTIDEHGGTVLLETTDGVVRVDVPPGAVDHDIQIEIAAEDPPDIPAEGYALVGDQVYDITASVTDLDAQVTITLPVPGTFQPDVTYTIMWLDEGANTWIPIPGTVDASSGTISGQVSHFSLFGVFLSLTEPACPDEWGVFWAPSQPSLVQIVTPSVLERGFLIGTEVVAAHIAEYPEEETLVRHFNFVTPGNEMKWASLQPSHDSDYQWHTADWIVNEFAAANGLAVKGHTLLWHYQNPDYVADETDPGELARLLREHITTVLEHYKESGHVKYWDVVNEAFDDDGKVRTQNDLPADETDDQGQVVKNYGPVWGLAYGTGAGDVSDTYIIEAFKIAYCTDRAAVLIYNDCDIETLYNNDGSVNLKTKSVRDLMQRIRTVTEIPDENLGVGFQCHFKMQKSPDTGQFVPWPDPGRVRATLRSFSDLNVHLFISELDMRFVESCESDSDCAGDAVCGPDEECAPVQVDDAALCAQGQAYKDFIKAIADVHNLRGITMWGLTDEHSWYEGKAPLLFGPDYSRDDTGFYYTKPAYWGLREGLSSLSDVDRVELPTRDDESVCQTDSQCDDGDFCNGSETCVDGACTPSELPCLLPMLCNPFTQTCVECLVGADCPEGQICEEGTCIVPGSIWRVDAASPAGGDGRTWATAFRHPQDAVDAASTGDEIWVAEGTYSRQTAEGNSVLSLKDGVAVYGGFGGHEVTRSERDWSSHETTLDGESSVLHVVVGASNARLDGFIITNGNANGNERNGQGGGVFGENLAGFTLIHCTVVDNQATSTPGAAFFDCADLYLAHTRFSRNDGGSSTVHIRYSSSTIVESCIFEDNDDMGYSGPLWIGLGSATVQNCLFYDNDSTGHAIAYAEATQPATFNNCTFYGNSTGGGGTIQANYEGTVNLSNCILWGNAAPKQIYIMRSATVTATYCDIAGGYDGVGNIDADPLFADPANDDYRLGPDSPCIDAGDAAPTSNDGARPPGLGTQRNDMGAYGGPGNVGHVEGRL